MNSVIVADGDSITANTGEDSNAVLSSRYMDQALALLSESYDYKNIAVGGFTTS